MRCLDSFNWELSVRWGALPFFHRGRGRETWRMKTNDEDEIPDHLKPSFFEVLEDYLKVCNLYLWLSSLLKLLHQCTAIHQMYVQETHKQPHLQSHSLHNLVSATAVTPHYIVYTPPSSLNIFFDPWRINKWYLTNTHLLSISLAHLDHILCWWWGERIPRSPSRALQGLPGRLILITTINVKKHQNTEATVPANSAAVPQVIFLSLISTLVVTLLTP